jgi:hypothetical protein
MGAGTYIGIEAVSNGLPMLEVTLKTGRDMAPIQLALRGSVCLSTDTIVQLGRILSSARCVPTSALGGLLALLLLVATTFSVSHELHQSLHQDRAANGHFCLVCSFAKGQVSVAAVAVFSAVLVFCCLWGVCPLGTSPFPGFDYRTSPSRAPPRL